VHTTVASFTQLPSGGWRVQVRRKNRYVAETFRRRKDGEEWALDIERNIDRCGSPRPRSASIEGEEHDQIGSIVWLS